MDDKYKNNIKWFRILGVIVGLGLLGFGIARVMLAGDIFSLGEFGLLGLTAIILIFAITAKMEHDLGRESIDDEEKMTKSKKDLIDAYEHDIGY